MGRMATYINLNFIRNNPYIRAMTSYYKIATKYLSSIAKSITGGWK